MTIQNIRLQDFRSYRDQAFEFEQGVNIIVGPNASGKTNLLEAILLITRGNTYKTSRPEELIRHRRPWARVDVMGTDNLERTLKITRAETSQKQFVINDETTHRLPASKRLPVVLFEPAQLYLLTTSPEARRSFVDDILDQTSAEFRTLRNSFTRTLRQRNALLKQPNKQAAKDQVFAWNIRFSETAGRYIEHRLKLLEQLNKTLAKRYNHIADSKHTVKLHYKTTLPTKNYATVLLKKLEEAFDEDYARGFTSLGPQRDDISVQIDNFELKETASRGEVRTTLLALKLTEADLIESITGRKPLFLLDDVFGELDGRRRHALTDYLQDHQAFITTTDADLIQKNFAQKAHIISLG